MKKIYIVIAVLASLSFSSFAQRDVKAWKNEENVSNQYSVFKENLNYWSGKYFLTGDQLDEFYGAMNDTIASLENRLHDRGLEISKQKEELAQRQALINETQQNLEYSQKLQNSITVFGMVINKSIYSTVMYLLILGVLVIAGIMFMMYQRSLKVTRQTKKEFDELKLEYDDHKKTALDRYTKINMELHKTRLELQKK